MRNRLALITWVALSLTPALPHASQDDNDAQFTAALQQGDTALTLRQFDDALKAFKRASGLRDKRSAEAHFGMARAYRELEAPKSAADSCTEALELDHEGTVRATKAGYNRSSTDGWLDREIRKLLKAMRDGTNEAPLQGGR
jgi:Tfp pilus assembly protein PilF